MDIAPGAGQAPAPLPEKPDRPASTSKLWQDGEFSFDDVLDIVNPLQHLPVIGTVYRAVTGDRIGNLARFVGGVLFAGPFGLVSAAIGAARAVADIALKESTGKDFGDTILAALVPEAAPAAAEPEEAEKRLPAIAFETAGARFFPIDRSRIRSAPLPAALPVSESASRGTESEIARKMLSALDKYAALERSRHRQAPRVDERL